MSGDSLTGVQAYGPTAGYFGKVPVRGDFLSHGLPREFIEPWDDWIQLALEHSRGQLSDGWLDIYLTSPVWHFALAPAICGDSGWAGVLMPSVDAVGRYFPFTIAAPLDPGSNITTVLSASQPWLLKVEELARSSLDDRFDLADFDREIQDLQRPLGETVGNGASQHDALDGRLLNAWRYALSSPDRLVADCPALLRELMDRLFFTYSFWWTAGSSRVSPTLLICQGLPPAEGYAAMLDGEWRQWGWEDKQVFEDLPGDATEQSV